MKKDKIQNIALIALFTAFICVCSFISIPFYVPITLQIFAIFVSVSLLGVKAGVVSVLLYLLLGAVGLPVFSNFSGGISHLFSQNGAYLFGFIVAVLITGLAQKKLNKTYAGYFLSMLFGLIGCYLFGAIYFTFLFSSGEPLVAISIWFMSFVLPFMFIDIIKISLAATLVVRLKKYGGLIDE